MIIEHVPFKSGLFGQLETYNVTWPCLTSDDFIFTISDKIGDGLCHNGVCGSYSLKVNGVEIASANESDNYSYKKVTHFTCSDIDGAVTTAQHSPATPRDSAP